MYAVLVIVLAVLVCADIFLTVQLIQARSRIKKQHAILRTYEVVNIQQARKIKALENPEPPESFAAHVDQALALAKDLKSSIESSHLRLAEESQATRHYLSLIEQED